MKADKVSLPSEVDRQLVASLAPRRKIQALMKAAGHSFATMAGEVTRLYPERGCWGEQVKACIYGSREYPHIRETLAAVLRLPIEEVNAALDADDGAVTGAAA